MDVSRDIQHGATMLRCQGVWHPGHADAGRGAAPYGCWQ
jgi:hypothetical protein